MAKANIDDRTTIERIYPRHAFDEDVGRNSDAKAVVHHGLRIESGPDAAGSFSVSRASRHAAEKDLRIHSIFLAPSRGYDAGLAPGDGAYGGAAERSGGSASEDRAPADAYAAFIDEVLGAARSARFQTLDPGDERLKGFHGG
jgi:hypothetical protein